jgi:hypothetical protein
LKLSTKDKAMRLLSTNASKAFTQILPSLAFLAGWMVVAPFASADSWSNVVQIEEHWELQIAQPESDLSAPQTTMVMSPIADLSGIHFLFVLNHVNAPGFEAGGMHAQYWDGDNLVQEAIAGENGALESNGETIRWVQRMTIEDGTLTFEVVNGQSDTWGSFGSGDLSFSVPTSLTKLNGYLPGVSIGESQVSYAENRVTTLVLTKLRWVKANGQSFELNSPIPVDTSLDE